MNNSQFKQILIFSLLLLLFSACSKQDYTHVIPADANLVARVDLAELASQAELGSSPLTKLLKSYVTLAVSGDELKAVQAAIDDPSILGIDFSQPAYLFQTPDHSWGLVFKVDDDDLLENAISVLNHQQLATKLTTKDGLRTSSLLGEIQLSFDGQTLLLMAAPGTGTPAALLGRNMRALYEQENDNSFSETPANQRLADADAPLSLYGRLTALPQQVGERIAELLPAKVKANDVEVCLSATFAAGEARVALNLFSDNESVNKLFDDAHAHLHTLRGDYLSTMTDDAVAWISFGCEGNWLLEKLKENKQANELLFALERGIDIEQMLRAVDGDVAFVLPNTSMLLPFMKTDFSLFATLDNSDFLADVDDWRSSAANFGMTLTPTGTNKYLLLGGNYHLLWGVADQSLYLSTTEVPAPETLRSQTDSRLEAYRSEIQESEMFALLNVEALDRFGSNPLQTAIIRSQTPTQFEAIFVAKDKSTNILTSILSVITQYIK